MGWLGSGAAACCFPSLSLCPPPRSHPQRARHERVVDDGAAAERHARDAARGAVADLRREVAAPALVAERVAAAVGRAARRGHVGHAHAARDRARGGARRLRGRPLLLLLPLLLRAAAVLRRRRDAGDLEDVLLAAVGEVAFGGLVKEREGGVGG